MEAITLSLKQFGSFSNDEFYNFCQDNPNLKFERSAQGQIIIMPNTGGQTGDLNSELNMQMRIWNKQSKLGKVFDSSTAFQLPSSAVRSPDVAWVSISRWQALSDEQQTKFPPLCPDFVIELRSETDNLKELQKKMTDEWLGNGCSLAWLIDPKEEKAYIYRPTQALEVVSGFDQTIGGGEVLPNFVLDLRELKNLG
ncbi:MAG: Uma2 family endonuclease [Microscillaceae bacterium]|jgi:Uma2 family endonuclease|nr:Uma2 family endonuclease [Microscillaceae bacterium]